MFFLKVKNYFRKKTYYANKICQKATEAIVDEEVAV